MKSAIIVMGIVIFLAYAFLLYCCVRVGADAERLFRDSIEKKMRQVDKNAENSQ